MAEAQQRRAESGFFVGCSVLAVLGRSHRKKLAVGLVEAMDSDVITEGDALNVARQVANHGDTDICRGKLKTSYFNVGLTNWF